MRSEQRGWCGIDKHSEVDNLYSICHRSATLRRRAMAEDGPYGALSGLHTPMARTNLPVNLITEVVFQA